MGELPLTRARSAESDVLGSIERPMLPGECVGVSDADGRSDGEPLAPVVAHEIGGTPLAPRPESPLASSRAGESIGGMML